MASPSSLVTKCILKGRGRLDIERKESRSGMEVTIVLGWKYTVDVERCTVHGNELC